MTPAEADMPSEILDRKLRAVGKETNPSLQCPSLISNDLREQEIKTKTNQ
jgi:hypothetical protein